MKITLKVEKEFEVKFLQVKAGVRYWEDATVDGVEDEEGVLIPCRQDDYWCPLINVNDGQVNNWVVGRKADIHYKVCDDGYYTLLDSEMKPIKEIEGYVPNAMCTRENGYGDYIIMHIDENGFIKDWKDDFDEFIDLEE